MIAFSWISICESNVQKATKKKKAHAFKSKQRLEMLEVGQNKRQNAWQEFQTGGKKAKVWLEPGFLEMMIKLLGTKCGSMVKKEV